MVKKTLILFTFFSLVCCSSPTQSGQKMYEQFLDKKNVIGIWTSGENENATFEIDKDSIYYVDALQRFKYILNEDSLTIKFIGYEYKCKIQKATNDSLIFVQEEKRTKFWRFKY